MIGPLSELQFGDNEALVSFFSAQSIRAAAKIRWPHLDLCHVTGEPFGWDLKWEGGAGFSHIENE